ncbi:uncharacterized protein LOC114127658 isoform X1 [Aphis gossypii]|uniref:uncharacterized protein LOC114127658 isoform X1 n=1 Tax=Aphis gossypii TaxID=80765 RepID=UPI00100E11E0|nr:uncharacterized protein LOC114127658 isoform X1 [Aphis gossypii]XP_027847762.1 uncharacterized protein LOC114127658 isoform X1 [Aphis gossypii]
MFKCGLCSYRSDFKRNLRRHTDMHLGIRYSCALCSTTFTFLSSVLRHIKNIHRIVANHSHYKRHGPDTIQGNDAKRRPYNRKFVAQDNVLHETVRHPCDLCPLSYSNRGNLSRHIKKKHGIDEYRKHSKMQGVAQDVPNIKSELYVIDISSDDETCMKPLNELENQTKDDIMQDACTTSLTAVKVEKTPIDNSVGIKTTSFNLHSCNPLGMVHQNEYLHKGVLNYSNENQSFSTPKKRCILRKLYEEYGKTGESLDKRLAWASHAGSLSLKLNLELRVIGMLMLDYHTDNGTPVDEDLIQMLLQDSHFCVENVHCYSSQYYIFTQLVYGLKKIYETGSEHLQNHRKSNWMKNTITVLKYLEFTDDTADFMIERMEKFI